MNTVLMHTCCAPCSLSCIDPLRAEGLEPVAFWYNPNIHPWKQYQARRACLFGIRPHHRHGGAGTGGLRPAGFCPPCGSRYRPALRILLRTPAEGHGPVCGRARLCRLYHHPTGQFISGPRWNRPRCGSGMPENTASPSSIGTSGPISAPEISWPGKRGFICRSTAAAFSQSRTATKSRLTGIAPGFRRGDPPQPGGRQNVFLFPGTGL